MFSMDEGNFRTKRRLAVYSYLIQKKVKKILGITQNDSDINLNLDSVSHHIDDLPLTLSKDPYPGLRHRNNSDSLHA